MSPPSFPPTGPCTGAALSSAGSLGLVPLLHRSYCGTPTPHRSSSPHFVSSFGGTPAPTAAGHRGSNGASQVPGDPSSTCPALRPRWTSVPGPCASSRSSTSVLPSACCKRRRLHNDISELHHTACTLAVYASQPGSTSGPRKTRFRLGANLGRAGDDVLASRWDPSRSFRSDPLPYALASRGSSEPCMLSTSPSSNVLSLSIPGTRMRANVRRCSLRRGRSLRTLSK